MAPPTFWAVVPSLTRPLGQGESVLLAVGARRAGRAVGALGEAGGVGPRAIWAAEWGVCGWRGRKGGISELSLTIVITISQICLQIRISIYVFLINYFIYLFIAVKFRNYI